MLFLFFQGYCVFVAIIGKLQIGFILGDITSSLSNANIDRISFGQRLDVLKVKLLTNLINTLLWLWSDAYG